MSRRRLVALSILVLVPLVATAAQDVRTMRDVLASLLALAPDLLQPGAFDSAANHTRIEATLESLAASAHEVDQHGVGLDPSFDRARRSFADDTRDALQSYRDGDFEVSRFLLRNLTENCFDCHSRLPAVDRDELATAVAGAIDLGAVPVGERMRLLVATRQFEAARLQAEALLADPRLEPALIDGMGIFEDYFKVCLRVERDFERPRQALQRFLERGDLPVYLHLQVQDWLAALEHLQGLETADRLAAAEGLLREARERNLYLQDRRGLIHATLASGLLHEYVLSAPAGSGYAARAYYMLGLAESAISRRHWVPETEYYLELAVRSAPGSQTARDAYVFYEQFVIANYTGSVGTDLPDEVRTRLEEMRALAFRDP